MGENGGYLFPNDLHILWELMIVMYPYVTGLVAGAFILSSLYHVFHREELRPIGRLSLVASLGFLLFAPATLLLHLGHPFRSLNIMLTPNLSSAMAMFGFIYAGYLMLLVFEIWLVHRADIIVLASRSAGIKRTFYKCLALGVYDISEESQRIDHRVLIVLAGLGIPAASLLHGYVGFIFGAVKANAWWSTPLMPIIFLCSAIVSGIAMVIILYQVGMTVSGRRIDAPCMQSLARWLWLFVIMSVTLELLEIMTLAYEAAEEWEVIGPLLANQLGFSFIGIQLILGAMVPIILLGIVVLMSRYLTDQIRNTLCFAASLLLLLQVFAMRWNVVIGGQLFSKSFRGYREGHTPGLFEKEGIVAAILIFVHNMALSTPSAMRLTPAPAPAAAAEPETRVGRDATRVAGAPAWASDASRFASAVAPRIAPRPPRRAMAPSSPTAHATPDPSKHASRRAVPVGPSSRRQVLPPSPVRHTTVPGSPTSRPSRSPLKSTALKCITSLAAEPRPRSTLRHVRPPSSVCMNVPRSPAIQPSRRFRKWTLRIGARRPNGASCVGAS